MGATLIDENMRAVFVLFTIAFIAAAFAATHEEIHSEAIELISDMKKKGATEADCKDLAKTTCKEVVDEQIKDQKVINSQQWLRMRQTGCEGSHPHCQALSQACEAVDGLQEDNHKVGNPQDQPWHQDIHQPEARQMWIHLCKPVIQDSLCQIPSCCEI